METKKHDRLMDIALTELEQNVGQIEGLPKNPRQWTKAEIRKMAKSLKETPLLHDPNPMIVILHNGKYVIIGGNLRYDGAKYNKYKTYPCVILPEDTPAEMLCEIAIKDNTHYGQYDYDELANNWGDFPLVDWGVPAWDVDTPPEPPADKSNETMFKVEVDFAIEADARKAMAEFKNIGYVCRIVTVQK